MLMFVGIIWAYVAVIKGIVKRCSKKEHKRNLAYELFDENQTIRRLEKNLLHSYLFKARNILSSFSAVQEASQEKRMAGNEARG